jgi:hypothetical protein
VSDNVGASGGSPLRRLSGGDRTGLPIVIVDRPKIKDRRLDCPIGDIVDSSIICLGLAFGLPRNPPDLPASKCQ